VGGRVGPERYGSMVIWAVRGLNCIFEGLGLEEWFFLEREWVTIGLGKQ